MIKRMIFGMVLASLTIGCGSDQPDFEIATDLPRTKLIGEFADLATAESDLREAGISLKKVSLTRPTPEELLFTIPSSENDAGSTFHMQFVEGAQPGKTTIRVKIDVPAVKMGLNKELSENKVETHFEKYVNQMVNAIRDGRSTALAADEFVSMFDTLALVTNPSDKKRLDQAMESEKKGWQSGWRQEASIDDDDSEDSAPSSARSSTKPGWEKPTWGSAR